MSKASCRSSGRGDCSSNCHADHGANSNPLDGSRPPVGDLLLQASTPGVPTLCVLEGPVLLDDVADASPAEGVLLEELHLQAARMAICTAACAHCWVCSKCGAALAGQYLHSTLVRVWAHNPRDCISPLGFCSDYQLRLRRSRVVQWVVVVWSAELRGEIADAVRLEPNVRGQMV